MSDGRALLRSVSRPVLHLVGSAQNDFFADLSRLYARDCLAATAGSHEPVIAWVDPAGTWRFPASLERDAIAAAEPLPAGAGVAHLASLAPDVAVPQMFCRPGMTAYRALLDVLGIPYVGNPPEVMAAGADKAVAKATVAAAGVDTPAGEVLARGERPTVAPPAVVKPADADNSHGVTLVRDGAGFADALDAAFAHADRVLVEPYVELGREVRCGVLERDGDLVVLPLEEYRLDTDAHPIRAAADKLRRDDGGELTLVAKDDPTVAIVAETDPITEAVGAAARACHTALGCRDYGLFDFRVDPTGRPWFLEAGLYCSFAPSSVIAVMAAAAGIGLDDLFATAVGQALARG